MLTINDTRPLKSACFISKYLLTYLRQKGKYGNRPPAGSRLLMCLDGIIYYNLLYYIIVHWWNIIQLDLLGQTLTVILNSCLWLSDFCFLNIHFKLPDASICVWIARGCDTAGISSGKVSFFTPAEVLSTNGQRVASPSAVSRWRELNLSAAFRL